MAITGSAKLAGVIGWPVSHSLSPRLHGYWLKHYEIDGAYVPFAVQPEDLHQTLRALPKMGFKGVNVTVPHKENALSAMDHVSETARRLGAINTIIIDEDGFLWGDNTDGVGFIESLRNNVFDLNFSDCKPVVLGAGGAARAIVASLQDAGVPEIQLVNRTLERSQALARDLQGNITVLPWGEMLGAVQNANVLINTTSLGMTGHEPLNIDFTNLPNSILVTDVVYNPLMTPILTQALDNGNAIVDGLDMLLYQAKPGFAAWFGIEPKVTRKLRDFVLEGFEA